MTASKKYPLLWESEKYLRWHKAHANPRVVMPLPTGGKRPVTVLRREGEDELDFFTRCVEERDAMGRALWGETTWQHMLSVKSRSVTRGGRSEEQIGVRHVVREGRPSAWVAYWNERDGDGQPCQRSKSFSYGSPGSKCSTSSEAKAKAEEVRSVKEKSWYIADQRYFYKRKPTYSEQFKNQVGAAIAQKLRAMKAGDRTATLISSPDKEALKQIQAKKYATLSLEQMLDIAGRLGVSLELTVHPGPAHAE